NIIVDDLRNDGINRLYLWWPHPSGWGQLLCEYTWDGSSWTKVEIKWFSPFASSDTSLNIKKSMETKIAIWGHNIDSGKIKNDNLKRLYTYYNKYFYEFTWNGSKWVEEKNQIPTDFNYNIYAVLIADARNDGKNRLYLGQDKILEYEWTGTAWVSTEILYYSWSLTIVIGPGRNDGINRIYRKYIYTLPMAEHLDELSWENGTWVNRSYKIEESKETKIKDGFYHVEAPRSALSVATISDGRNDGVQRIYLVDDTGLFPGKENLITELTWNGSGWDIKDYKLNVEKFINTKVFAFFSTITPIKANLKMISSGLSDNVEMKKLYTSDMSEYVFAYPQPAYSSAKTQADKLQPVNNYFKQGSGWTTVWYQVDTPGNVTIKLYTIDGAVVRTLYDGYRGTGEYSDVWTGRSDVGEVVGTGIYLINLTAPGVNVTKKICVVR
ncbi:MAG: hypothetical protein AB1633_08525, partial [Elusimicrobiota bacterium]